LQERQDRAREMNAFLSLCRKSFANMPGTVTFQARLVPDGDRVSAELIFRNAPGMLWWGSGDETASTILGVRGQVGGLVGMGILQDSEEEIASYLNGDTARAHGSYCCRICAMRNGVSLSQQAGFGRMTGLIYRRGRPSRN